MVMIGELALWVAVLFAAWACTSSFGGALRRTDLVATGERAIYALGVRRRGLARSLDRARPTTSLCATSRRTPARNLPTLYTLTAFWAGQAGSMLFWALILTTYSAIAVWTNPGTESRAHAVRLRTLPRNHALFSGDDLLRRQARSTGCRMR